MPESTKQLLAEIARKHLGVETLETRKADDLDFYSCSVWAIEAALQAAYAAGTQAVDS